MTTEYQGKPTTLAFQGSKMRSNHTQMVAALIRAHVGIGYMPAWLADDDITAGKLIRLLPECPMNNPSFYAVYVNRQYMKAKVRSFIDFMSAQMAA